MKISEHHCRNFPLKLPGELHWYKGYFFYRHSTDGTLKGSQSFFVDTIVEKVEVPMYSPIPSCPRVELRPKAEDEPESEDTLRDVLGSLLWLVSTSRPDIADSLGAGARFVLPRGRALECHAEACCCVKGRHDLDPKHRRGVIIH